MTTLTEDLRGYLQDFNLEGLFIEGLGWDHFQARPLQIEVDEIVYRLQPAAEKAGFAVYVCDPDQDGSIPTYHAQQKIEHRVAKTAFEHLIVFVDAEQSRQVWQWVKREPGKSPRPRRWEYGKGQPGDSLLQRLQDLVFDFDDEAAGIEISDVTGRAQRAFDVEKVTKQFYENFSSERKWFLKAVKNVDDQEDTKWYASLMLNRMMFVYFIQKQGFLDGDVDYLRNRLEQLQQKGVSGMFQDFYRAFLLRLFHEGLGQPAEQRNSDLDELLGEVPFLNGGLFEMHDLERDYPEIQIPDEAFERVFEFFDGYRWHLDERPYREDNEINPDVLGYIFEKYINQKEKGAYYTKEDITGYISRNSVIPFLFDEAKKKCPVAFEPDGGVWGLLRDDPDRYIYPAIGHGLTWDARNPHAPKQIDARRDLPAKITAGIDDVSKRDGWNAPAPDDVALPTETWREVMARRQRYSEVRAKLEAGQVSEINDLITLNLDIERFAIDVIAQSEGPELVRAFWRALYGNSDRSDTGISVLDPTCGSGAFLFAALNILEPLYTTCLVGMRGFVDDLARTKRPHSTAALSDFRKVLEQVAEHPSESYFILKSIVLNNLYGVDIMEEAVEICKLRLFLKLVAQLESYDEIEPLPDIDFNIRAGNTLVGYPSLDAVAQTMTLTADGQHRALSDEERQALREIQEQAEIVDAAFQLFRMQQTSLGGQATAADKQELADWLLDLAAHLDLLLAQEYGVASEDIDAFRHWHVSHQPFHWFAEFYGIMSTGGFDVIIGNPPYVEYSKVKNHYTIRGYETEKCGNLYAYVLERSRDIAARSGSISMIVPLSSHSTKRMTPLLKSFYETFDSLHLHTISSDANPSRLFDGVKFRLAIFVASNYGHDTFTTRYTRWYSEARPFLFDLVQYTRIADHRYPTAIPKVSSATHLSVLQKLAASATPLDSSKGDSRSLVYHAAPVNWIRAHTTVPYFHSERDGERQSVELKGLHFHEVNDASAQAILCSSTYFLWWLSNSDCYHLNRPEIASFPFRSLEELEVLSSRLEGDMQSKTRKRVYHYKATGRVEYEEFYMKLPKPIIDEIDRVLAAHYGFTNEELDFIINYDIKYRMGL